MTTHECPACARLRTALRQIATGAAEEDDGFTYDEIAKIASAALDTPKHPITAWGTWQERAQLARNCKAGDRWVQIKSGRVAIVQGVVDAWDSVPLLHENGNKTNKWRNYFGQQYTPETPPVGSTGAP